MKSTMRTGAGLHRLARYLHLQDCRESTMNGIVPIADDENQKHESCSDSRLFGQLGAGAKSTLSLSKISSGSFPESSEGKPPTEV